MTRLALLPLFGALACAPEPAEKGAPADAADDGLTTGWHTLDHGGRTRDFSLVLPDDLPAGAPLLIALHGYSSSAETLQGYAGLDRLAAQHGFAVVYPDGTRDDWGYRYWEVGYDFHDGSVDDVGFLRALAAHVADDADLGPVFTTGMSNGGDMGYRLACEAPDLVTAVTSVAGTMMGWLADACDPADPVPLLEIHGTADDVTFWDGDPDNTGGWGPYLSTEAGVAHHVDLLGLDMYQMAEVADTDQADGSTVIAHTWNTGASDDAVWLLEVRGGGHDWPGVWGNQDILASEVVVQFIEPYR